MILLEHFQGRSLKGVSNGQNHKVVVNMEQCVKDNVSKADCILMSEVCNYPHYSLV